MSEDQVMTIKPRLLKLDDASCSCCKADFLKKNLDEQGRCPTCAAAGIVPGTKPTQEMIHSNQKISRDEVKAMVKEILLEMAKEKEEPRLAAKICTKCKSEFIPTFPAEKMCSSCREAK